MRYRALLFFCFLLSALLLGLMLFFNYQHRATTTTTDQQSPLARLEGLVVREYDPKSGCSFILNADNVTIPQGQQEMVCHDATLQMTKDNQITATMNIALAHINRATKVITCSESIAGTIHNMQLTTTACTYTFSTQELVIPTLIDLVGQHMKTSAPEAVINLQTGTITCDHGIKTELST